ncbi:MAG: type 4a pilus biogenesis protein PilO [Nitrospirae bacterium]|nr:type 4a pilus biogenesis protein PilO [Nitrospirota bacterium]
MAINLDIKNLPPYSRTGLILAPSIIVIALFIYFIYLPKNGEIKSLTQTIDKLDSEIASSEKKAQRLEALKIENARLRARLKQLQEQLPEEKEVSSLLRQVSDLGIKSGLRILLWRPEARVPDQSGLYIRIPVKVEVLTGYHNLGIFFSHISRLPRIVNISEIKLSSPTLKEGSYQVTTSFTATTFSAIGEEDRTQAAEKGKK